MTVRSNFMLKFSCFIAFEKILTNKYSRIVAAVSSYLGKATSLGFIVYLRSGSKFVSFGARPLAVDADRRFRSIKLQIC